MLGLGAKPPPPPPPKPPAPLVKVWPVIAAAPPPPGKPPFPAVAVRSAPAARARTTSNADLRIGAAAKTEQIATASAEPLVLVGQIAWTSSKSSAAVAELGRVTCSATHRLIPGKCHAGNRDRAAIHEDGSAHTRRGAARTAGETLAQAVLQSQIVDRNRSGADEEQPRCLSAVNGEARRAGAVDRQAVVNPQAAAQRNGARQVSQIDGRAPARVVHRVAQA